MKRGTRRPLPAKRSLIWFLLSIVLMLLGVNKQLDLQTLMTDIGRYFARADGWYDRRQEVQLLFIVTIGTMGLMMLTLLRRIAKGSFSDFRLPFVGLTLVVAFVVMRAASFHHIDRMLGQSLFGSSFNFIFESAGIIIIFVSAFLRVRKRT